MRGKEWRGGGREGDSSVYAIIDEQGDGAMFNLPAHESTAHYQ